MPLAVADALHHNSKPRSASAAYCNALNRVYSHGVGRGGARDKTGGVPVTNFKVSNALYKANRDHDRDHDGIACEKH